MGLNSFNPDDDDEPSSSSKKYEEISLEDFVDFLSKLPYDFVQATDHPSKEVVFESNVILEDYSDITLRVFSSIDTRTGKSRKKGADAIRTVIWHRGSNRPIGGRTRTHRIKTWRKNLKKKIVSLVEETNEYIIQCPECGGWLVERDGKYGKFLGCSNYPDCDHTEQIDD